MKLLLSLFQPCDRLVTCSGGTLPLRQCMLNRLAGLCEWKDGLAVTLLHILCIIETSLQCSQYQGL